MGFIVQTSGKGPKPLDANMNRKRSDHQVCNKHAYDRTSYSSILELTMFELGIKSWLKLAWDFRLSLSP